MVTNCEKYYFKVKNLKQNDISQKWNRILKLYNHLLQFNSYIFPYSPLKWIGAN